MHSQYTESQANRRTWAAKKRNGTGVLGVIEPAWRVWNGGIRLTGDKFSREAAHQTAADQPSQRFDKEIARQMLILFAWPAAHGVVAHQRNRLAIKEFKAWRAVRKPSDVLRGATCQPLRVRHQAAMQRAAHGLDKPENQTLRRRRAQKGESGGARQVAHEDAGREPRRLSLSGALSGVPC